MSDTIEGISSRKWSYQRTSDGILILMEGITPIAALTEEGAKVFNLLVKAPQLWDAANEMIKRAALIGGNASVISFTPGSPTAILANVVAAAAGKTSWQEVKQG